MKNKKIEVKCPKCKKKFNYYDSDFRPFCSKRCKMIDLGKWLSEEYSLPSFNPMDGDFDNEEDDNE